MDCLLITNDREQMRKIGKQIVSDRPNIYSPEMLAQIKNAVMRFLPDADDAEIEGSAYQAVYDYWAYGASFNEEFYYNFRDALHNEKKDYVTFRSRFLYIDHLNDKKDRYILDDKYALYEKLKPFYHRQMIKITNEADYPQFENFCKNHTEFVIKPVDLASARGVRKTVSPHSSNDIRAMFRALINEAAQNHKNSSWGRGRPSIVLEEFIRQRKPMSTMHPDSVNVVRMTTIKKGDKIHLFYPWVKFGKNGAFAAAAATDGCCALIDENSGAICSDGYDESGKHFDFHPNTHVQFQGFQIPEWNTLKELSASMAMQFDTLRYIGWDFAYSDKGWCVVEGNSQADFAMQLMLGKGIAPELESLLGWKPEKQFWWE